jgi:hypothetical protein
MNKLNPNNFCKIHLTSILLFIVCIMYGCVPESHWKKKYHAEFYDVCNFQDICFSALLFGIQGMQKTLTENGKTTYSDWPEGFDSLYTIKPQEIEYYLLTNKSDSFYPPSNIMTLYLDKTWPALGSSVFLEFSEEPGNSNKYKMSLTMQDTFSGGKWKCVVNIEGWGEQPYEYTTEGYWTAHYEINWDPKDVQQFEDDELSFSGLGKCKDPNDQSFQKEVLSFMTSRPMFIRSGVPGIWGEQLKLFPFNLPMATFTHEKLYSNFPDAYTQTNYNTPVAAESQGHFWEERFHYGKYREMLFQFGIVRDP